MTEFEFQLYVQIINLACEQANHRRNVLSIQHFIPQNYTASGGFLEFTVHKMNNVISKTRLKLFDDEIKTCSTSDINLSPPEYWKRRSLLLHDCNSIPDLMNIIFDDQKAPKPKPMLI